MPFMSASCVISKFGNNTHQSGGVLRGLTDDCRKEKNSSFRECGYKCVSDIFKSLIRVKFTRGGSGMAVV